MQSIKFVVRVFDKKAGGKFSKAEVKGKFLPLATAEDEVYYTVKFAGKTCELPTAEGIYEVSYNEGELWIDNRPEYVEKHILRVRPYKCVFNKPLPKIDKDIRVK